MDGGSVHRVKYAVAINDDDLFIDQLTTSSAYTRRHLNSGHAFITSIRSTFFDAMDAAARHEDRFSFMSRVLKLVCRSLRKPRSWIHVPGHTGALEDGGNVMRWLRYAEQKQRYDVAAHLGRCSSGGIIDEELPHQVTQIDSILTQWYQRQYLTSLGHDLPQPEPTWLYAPSFNRAIAAMAGGADCIRTIPSWFMAFSNHRIEEARRELKGKVSSSSTSSSSSVGADVGVGSSCVPVIYEHFALNPLFSRSVLTEVSSFLCPLSIFNEEFVPDYGHVDHSTSDDPFSSSHIVTDEQRYRYECKQADRLVACHSFGPSSSSHPEFQKLCAHLTTAIALLPKRADAYHRRGMAYHRSHQWKLEIADFTWTMDILPKSSPDYVEAAFGKADCLYNYNLLLLKQSSSPNSVDAITSSIDLSHRAQRELNFVLRAKPKHEKAIALNNVITAQLVTLNEAKKQLPKLATR